MYAGENKSVVVHGGGFSLFLAGVLWGTPIGVRAVDEAGNITTNTNYATVVYDGSATVQVDLSETNAKIDAVKKFQESNVLLEGTQAKYIDSDDGTTNLGTYDLLDEAGDPTTGVFVSKVKV